jgi:hypothetical protein
MDALGIAIFLAGLNWAILNYIASPIHAKWPNYDLWWFKWVALATGFVIGWFAGLNILGQYIANPILARILTGIVVGGGSEIINTVFGTAKSTPDLRGLQAVVAGGVALDAAPPEPVEPDSKRSVGW